MQLPSRPCTGAIKIVRMPGTEPEAMDDGVTVGDAQGAAALPTGAVTFLLTDIEGSTRGWEADRKQIATAVARHHGLLDEAVNTASAFLPGGNVLLEKNAQDTKSGAGQYFTSRYTNCSIFLRSCVSSTPSTVIRPFWCSSSRLMQRIIVDLPEPDGPQTTMRSPE